MVTYRKEIMRSVPVCSNAGEVSNAIIKVRRQINEIYKSYNKGL